MKVEKHSASRIPHLARIRTPHQKAFILHPSAFILK
jgi:hypothetical protein